MSVDVGQNVRPRVAVLATTAIICFVLAAVGIKLTRETGDIAMIWPMNAVVLAIVLQHARSSWHSILGAAVIGNLGAALLVAGDTPALAAILATANASEILVCAAALYRRDEAVDISKVSHLLRFLAFAGIAGPAFGALVAAFGLAMLKSAPLVDILSTWYGADALSMLVFAPAALTFGSYASKDLVKLRDVGSLLLLAAHAAVSAAVFSQSSLPLLFIPGPILILVAFRLGVAGVVIGLMITTAIAIVSVVAGHEPTQFTYTDTSSQIVFLQAYLAFLSLTTLPVATALAQRERMRRALEVEQQNLVAARKNIQKSETRFRQMARASSDMVAQMDMNGTINFVSPSAKSILGFDDIELVGHTTFDHTHPADIPAVKAFFADLVARGPNAQPRPYQFRARHKEGRWVWLEGVPHILFDANGTPIEIQDSVRDITARKGLEIELVVAVALAKASDRRLKMALDIADIIVYERDKARGTLIVTGNDERVLGKKLPSSIGAAEFFDLVHVDDRPEMLERWKMHLAGGPRLSIDHRLHHNGQWVRTVVEMMRNADGEHTGSVGLIMNIADQKTAELALEDARDKAEKSMHVKADFLANMSHEVRTPLNSIIGFGGLLAASKSLEARERHYVDIIDGSSRMLLRIVNDVLDYSSIESGAIRFNPRPFRLRKLIEEVADGFLPSAIEKGLAIQVCVEGPLAPVHICDDTRLRQIIGNLIGNAVKFTVSGAVTVTLEAAAASLAGQRLCLEVRDTGIGIAADKLPGLFKRFAQADSSINRRFGGSGLGLAISKHLVELMGGDIGATSEEGHGSTFRVMLDLPCASEADLVPDIETEVAEHAVMPLRLLVVDDVDLNRQLVLSLLAPFGHEIDEAVDGEEAIKAVKAKFYDLVLMDVQMPGIDGLSATRTIRELPLGRHVPIIAMTAQALPHQIGACRAAGMSDYVAKPVVPAELFAAVRRWTQLAADRAEQRDTPLMLDAMQRLRGKFIDRCRDDLIEMRSLMLLPAEEAAPSLHRLIHRLAGTAGSLGFDKVGAVASSVDQTFATCETPAPASLTQLVAELEMIVSAA